MKKCRRWVELQTDRNGFWNHPIFSTFAWWRSPDLVGILTATIQPPWSTDNEQHSGQTSEHQSISGKKGMSTWTSELPIGSMVLVYMLTLGVYWWQMLPYIAAPWILWARIYQDISGHSPAAPFRDQLNQVHRATVFVAPACTDRWRRRPVKFGWPLPPPKKTHRDHRRRLRASPAGQPSIGGG